MWDRAPSRPAEEVLGEILGKFNSLDWVPHFDESSPGSRRILENPICLQNTVFGGVCLRTDPALDMSQVIRDGSEKVVATLREAVNRWRSLQVLYRKAGWGTDRYVPEEFEALRREWLGRLEQFERQGRLARRRSAAQSEEIRLAKEVFLAESAGVNAV